MKFKNKLITFTQTNDGVAEHNPQPAKKFIPDWYKQTPSYINGKKEITNIENVPMTIKKCMPVFDAMTSGYYLFTFCDIYVKQQDGAPYYYWTQGPAVGFHAVQQAEKHPKRKDDGYPKFLNSFGIKTPPGYSCMFVNPMHNPSGIFTILEGIVDTDEYSAPVNFPFVLNDNSWEGLIPAGTPIVQVIPFKRDSWQMKLGKEEDIKNIKQNILKKSSKFFDAYKSLFWSSKEYN